MSSSQVVDGREKLRQHFIDKDPANQARDWEAMWQQNVSPWDRGRPSPALVDTVEQKTSFFGASALNSDGSRKKALVPGCGSGYDVFWLSGHGYDAYGLDSSPTAVERSQLVPKLPDFDDIYPTKDAGRGEAKVIEADFFKDDFFASTGSDKFDLIYDYTFLCALPPSLRPAWAKRMCNLLAPNGLLVCLMFPLTKPPNTSGPPHGLSSRLYESLLEYPGSEVQYDEEGYAKSGAADGAKGVGVKKLDEWSPERTHAAGQGHDRVSVWQMIG